MYICCGGGEVHDPGGVLVCALWYWSGIPNVLVYRAQCASPPGVFSFSPCHKLNSSCLWASLIASKRCSQGWIVARGWIVALWDL